MKKCTPEFISSIVILYSQGCSANFLVNEYNLTDPTVTGWVKKAEINGTNDQGQPINCGHFNTLQKTYDH